MAQEVLLYGSDQRLVLSNGEAIRQPIYTPSTERTGAASAATDEITLAAHGLIAGDKILVRGATPPTGLTAGNYYFVRDITTNTFKVSATSGGAAIDLTSDGTAWTWIKLTWNRVRIGIRLAFDTPVANITGTPVFAFGLCKGSANGFGALVTDHAVGFRTTNATMTYNAGAGTPYISQTSANQAFKKLGVTFTNSPNNIATIMWGISPTRTGIFLELTRANTNFTVAVAFPNAAVNGAQSDLTDTEFSQIMELSDLAAASVQTIKAGYSGQTGGTIAVNENDGILDHIFTYWERTTVKMGFDIKHRVLS